MQHWFLYFFIICLHLLHLKLFCIHMYPSICMYLAFLYIMFIYFVEKEAILQLGCIVYRHYLIIGKYLEGMGPP